MATRKPKINLATAKVADGALTAPTSIYEIVGISTTPYHDKDLDAYVRTIEGMSLIELHDHAYKMGVLAGPNPEILKERLQTKFKQEQNRFNPAVGQVRTAQGDVDPEMLAAAQKTIARGR